MAVLDKQIFYVTYNTTDLTFTGDTVIHFFKNYDLEDFAFTAVSPDVTFSPDTTDNLGENINIGFLPVPTVPGNYSFPASADSISQSIPFTIELTVTDQSVIPPPPPPVVLHPKYKIQYKNIEGDDFRLDIWDKDFEGETTDIRGNVKHNYTERKDLLVSTVPSNLDITLEADDTTTLTDLYSENERQFSVFLYRNDQMLFRGYLKPDGIWEDYVLDKWELSLDAFDGLSTLKDLSFVKDNGLSFQGKISQYEAVYYALRRIGYEIPINISDDLPVYTDYAGTESILKDVLINTERFYQEQETKAAMDCEEVLKSILEPYNATIIQMNGEWWIYRTIDVKPNMGFKKYVAFEDGVSFVWNPELEIGSHINESETHHIGANQKKSIDASIQAFRVNYKYGTVKSIGVNEYLKLGVGLDCEGWNIDAMGGMVKRQEDGTGVYIANQFSFAGAGPQFLTSDQLISVNTEEVFDITFKFRFDVTGFSALTYTKDRFTFTIATTNYVLLNSGWQPRTGTYPVTDYPSLVLENPNGLVSHMITTPPVLENGNIDLIKINIGKLDAGTLTGSFGPFTVIFNMDEIQISPNKANNTKGEFHTAQRKTRISSVTKADKTVNNGDSASNIYWGTLFKGDGSQTTTWNREGRDEELALLQIMVEDTLRIRPRPMLYFEGNVYGYYPYLSRVLINNITGKFQPSKYSFDTITNINNASFKEYATDYLVENTDFTYAKTLDYGNVTKVVINP